MVGAFHLCQFAKIQILQLIQLDDNTLSLRYTGSVVSYKAINRTFLNAISVLVAVGGLFSCSTAGAQTVNKKTISVYFPSDGDRIDAEGKSLIRQAILQIQPHIIKEIYIEGHTDSDASNAYNLSLSNRRASNAKDFLLSQGISSSMIQLGAFGESQPTSKQKSKNRRVRITLVYQEDDFPPKPTNLVAGEAKYLHFTTYDALTKDKLPTDYVVEIRNKNHFARTGQDAECLFDRRYFKSINITFLKTGYLNESVTVEDKNAKTAGDTMKFKVYLRPVNVVQKLRFDNIFFYTDTDEFKPEAKKELEKIYQYLVEEPTAYIEIQGHMNFSESRNADILQRIYNHDLSHKRAKEVFKYLISRGIDKNRLTYKGMSNFKMIYPNPKNKFEADKNKRVEIWTLSLKSDQNN